MAPTQPGRSCILVVDDDPDLRETLIDLLGDEGYRATGVANGQEALRQLRHIAPPCLILLDLMMPVMTGWEFREQQRQDPRLAAIPVAVVTGVRNSQDQLAALDAVGYFQKPLDINALLDTVAHYC